MESDELDTAQNLTQALKVVADWIWSSPSSHLLCDLLSAVGGASRSGRSRSG